MFFCIIVMFVFFLYKGVPAVMADKPVIDKIVPNKIMAGVQFNEDNIIKLYGHGLAKIKCFYINNIFEGEVIILSQTDESVEIKLPQRYYDSVQELRIRAEARNNSELFCCSNDVLLEVASDESVPMPQITSIEPEKLKNNGTAMQEIVIKGTGFAADSKVLINGEQYMSVFDEDEGVLVTKIPFIDWCNEEKLEVQVIQSYNGYLLTNKSSAGTMETYVGDRKWKKLKDPWIQETHVVLEPGADFTSGSGCTVKDIILQNYLEGQQVFELKFAFSEDNVLYTVVQDGQETFLANGLPDTYIKNKERQRRKGLLMSSTFEEICELLHDYKDIFIMFNIVEPGGVNASAAAYQYVAEHLERTDKNIWDQLIIQTDDEKVYQMISDIYPVTSAIFDLESSLQSGKKEYIMEFLSKSDIKAVNVPLKLLSEKLFTELKENNYFIFVSGAENIGNINYFLMDGVYGLIVNKPLRDEQKQVLMDCESVIRLLSINDFEEYIEAVKQTDYLCLLSVRDDAAMGGAGEMYEAVCGLGAQKFPAKDIRSSYIFVSRQNEVLAEEVSAVSNVKWRRMLDDSIYVNVQSAGLDIGDYSLISINGTDYSMNKRGINIVLYDMNEQRTIDSVNFDIFAGGIFSRKVIFKDKILYEDGHYENYDILRDYLYKAQNERYITILSVADDAGSNMTEEIQNALYALGLKKPLIGAFRNSYIAVINGGSAVYEDKSEQSITFSTEIEGLNVMIESVGNIDEPHANIVINGVDYSPNARGLNMVVYDKFLGVVRDCLCFDLFDGYAVTFREDESRISSDS